MSRSQLPAIPVLLLFAVVFFSAFSFQPAADPIVFVRISAGSFLMGSTQGFPDEAPEHEVYISREFEMSVHEITQSQFESVMGANPSIVSGADLPVENVSWAEAAEFCRRLGERDGRRYRLPTEAEWEYAARAGRRSETYVWGNTPMPVLAGAPLANVADCRAREIDPGLKIFEGLDDRFGRTAPVGSYPANPWGLHDMAGNVWEWCQDFYGENYYAVSPAVDPTGPEVDSGSGHVFRGGSWDDGPKIARVALRGILHPGQGDRIPNVGFRIVRETAGNR